MSSAPPFTAPTGDSTTSGSLLLLNGRVWLGADGLFAEAMAVRDGKILETGTSEVIKAKYATQFKPEQTLDVAGRTVVPGLHDSHLHVIREGMHFNMELRWDGVRSLKEGLAMIAEQAKRTPPGQWVRVVGGWAEHQFEEKRLPTLAELDEAGGNRPVFVLHLYDCALVNQLGLSLLGYTAETPNPPSGEIVRGADGKPTGLLIARPNAFLLYNTLNMLPKMSFEQQVNSTLAYQRELHRFGVTSVMDPGGGFQNYPEDYKVIQHIDKEKQLNLRIHFSLFPQKPKQELDDFKRWSKMIKPGDGSAYLRHLGAGEMLAFSAADFEDFKEARPDLPEVMESELEAIVRFLVSVKWPFRLHATYGESIERELVVFEKVAADDRAAFVGLRWFIDHAETISAKDAARIAALGGGIAIQHRMAFQGEYFQQRYGLDAAQQAPPIKLIQEAKVPYGAGTDGTRVATYNPWVSLLWLSNGRSVGNVDLSPNASLPRNVVSRSEALHLWTHANSWFTHEESIKGKLAAGFLADFVVLQKDYFTCEEREVRDMEAALTVVDGRIVYAAPKDGVKGVTATPQLALQPEWSPVNRFGGYQIAQSTAWTRVQTALHDDAAAGAGAAAPASSSSESRTQPKPVEFFEHGHDC